MSNISLEGNASGTGTFTIAAPNTSSNFTLTLPQASGTIALGTGLTGVTDSASPFETSLGEGAGGSSTGVRNTFIGFEAGNDNTTGTDNTAVGYQALDLNTTGVQNTAVGVNALGLNTTGQRNTAVGVNVLRANTTGSNNTGLGAEEGDAGYAPLWSNTTGDRNVAVGNGALGKNTTGSFNVSMGYRSLAENTTANNNVAIGYHALIANTTGADNTAVGYQALDACTTGIKNTAFGRDALGALTTSNNNCAFGTGALGACTTGAGNLAFGDITDGGRIFTVTTENNRAIFGHDSVTNAYVKVAFTVTSDARDKTEIQSVPHGLSFVQQLNPVSYRWKTNREDDTPVGNRRYGFLAQEVMALEGDDPVIIDNEQPEHLKYQGEALVPVLVNAIKELKAEVDALKAQLATPPAEPNA